MKVIVVIGTRPDAIKMAPLIKRLEKSKIIELIVLSTSQHTDLLSTVLNEFQIKPHISFKLRREKSGLHHLVTELTQHFNESLPQLAPSVVLGHGDTASCFAAALCCFHLGIKFFHVEAGLRSHDLTSPYPEEFYRQSISKLTHTHFCPDEDARGNLLREGVEASRIVVSGNTIEEALSFALAREIHHKKMKKYILMTIHRREKTAEDFLKLKEVLLRHPEKKFIFIEHPNPEIKRRLDLYLKFLPNLEILPPQNYFVCASLVKNAQVVLTDSGGMQEEASLLRKPLIIYRSKTERDFPQENTLLSMDLDLIDCAIESFFSLEHQEDDLSILSGKQKMFPSSFVESTLLGDLKCMI